MKLFRLYSNQKQFKPIKFNRGLNIVYGKVEVDDNSEDGTVKEHNLGKTSLVHLIDFMLIKRVDKGSYLVQFSEKFLNWTFFMEVELNDGTYVTIRRSVGTPIFISFRAHPNPNQDFSDEEEWDYTDLSIYSTKRDSNPVTVFQDKYLKFDTLTKFPFRTFLPYLLRTQYDYTDVFKLERFEGSDSKWKPQLLDVLGFDEALLKRKYKIDEEIKTVNKVVTELKPADDKDKYKLRAAIAAKEEERAHIQARVDQFNFYKEDNEINNDLVKEVEQEISLLNDHKYALSYEIEQIQLSLDNEQVPDLQLKDIDDFFQEMKTIFPDDLKKEYGDVLSFAQQLSGERQKYLRGQLTTLRTSLKNANKQLIELDAKRGDMLAALTETDSFKKFKSYQAQVSLIDKEVFDYRQRLRDIERVQLLREEVEQRKDWLDQTKQAIEKMLEKDPDTFIEIRKHFMDIYRTVFEYTATLMVTMNKKGNVEFEPLVLTGEKNTTGKSQGYTSRRVMCASFVLAVLATYSQDSFFRFAYHDGIMEEWGDGHKRSFINLVRRYGEDYGIQYITSVIDSNMPADFKFEEDEIIRTLSKNDTLFNVDF